MSKPKIVCFTASNSSDQDERIRHDLTQLGLLGMLPYFEKLAEENIRNHGTPKDYLEVLLGKQRIYKENGRIHSRVNQAGFGKLKTLEEFNFKRKIKIDERQIRDLARCSFIKENKHVIFLGQSGVGKTHLSKGLGKQAIDQGFNVKFIELDKLVENLFFKCTDVDSQKRFFDSLERPELLILDEIKYREATPAIQDFMYRLIRQRHEQKSTMFTSNKEFPEWEKLFGEYAEAALDRILDKKYLILINLEGKSNRINPLSN